MPLEELRYLSDLNCSTNLKRIVQRLPNEMQHKWAEEAENLLWVGLELYSDARIELFERYASIATNCYGVLANETKSDIDTAINFQRSTRRTHLNIRTTEMTGKCPKRSKSHELASCKNSLSMTRENRFKILRSLQLCFNCLLPKHRAFACRNPVRCSMCNQKQYRLLHHVDSQNVAKTTMQL